MSERNALPLPLQIAEIDSAWLTAALRVRFPDIVVEDSELVDVIPGTCTKIRIRLKLNQAGRDAGVPELVFLKGGFEDHSRAMSHVHLSEVRGYRDVFPFASLPTPRCFFADYDDDRQQGIVIMEDLAAIGVEFCNALRPQSFDQVARRLSALAKFHAQTWETPELAPGGRLADIPDGESSLRRYMDQYLLKPEEWKRFIEAPRGAAVSTRFHDLQVMTECFDRLVELADELPHCVIHGDTHLNNLYVYPDGTPGFFDSLPGHAPAMREVAYHTTCALDIADRKRWIGPLIQHYLQELRKHGVAAPTFDEAFYQYSAFLLDGLIIFIVNESFYQSESTNTAYAARFGSAMLDYDTIGLLLGR